MVYVLSVFALEIVVVVCVDIVVDRQIVIWYILFVNDGMGFYVLVLIGRDEIKLFFVQLYHAADDVLGLCVCGCFEIMIEPYEMVLVEIFV
jgi:hypothetical protein